MGKHKWFNINMAKCTSTSQLQSQSEPQFEQQSIPLELELWQNESPQQCEEPSTSCINPNAVLFAF